MSGIEYLHPHMFTQQLYADVNTAQRKFLHGFLLSMSFP